MRPALKNFVIGVILSCVLVVCIYCKLFYPPLCLGMGDPDRYFHLKIAELTALNGLVHTLPQAEDLGWRYFFPDKEFLFHLLGGLAYKIGGEWGALSLVPVSALLILLSLYFAFSARSLFKLASWEAFLISSVTVFAVTPFSFRLFLMRPHLLGILFWIVLTLGLIAERGVFIFFGSALFALSYHAYYMPLFPAAIYLFLPISRQNPHRWKTAAMVPAGLIVGSVLNPYFPGNIVMGWTHLKIALGIGLPILSKGHELDRLAPATAAWEARWQLGVLLAGLAFIIQHTWRQKRQLLSIETGRRFLFAWILCLSLGMIYFMSPRSNEYWVPACGITLAALLTLSRDAQRKYLVGIASLLSIGVTMPELWTFYRSASTTRYPGKVDSTFAAISKLPSAASGSKVFNCNWASGSQIFYARPDLRFVDLLEPAFLYLKNPDAHYLREALNSGQISTASEAVSRGFGARFVICDNPNLKGLLERDPKIKILGPQAPVTSQISVAYEILER